MLPLLFSFENVYRHYIQCRKNKRNTINALRFEVDQEKELVRLTRALADHTYRPGRSVCFFSEKPNLREIFAADFKDRIVHHILVDYLESIWEPVFIHDSYACRKGKGIHKGVSRLQKFIRQITANGTRRAFYLQLDIQNYFMRIDKAILFDLIRKKCPDQDALWLSHLLIFHDCTIDPAIKGDRRLAEHLPPHKTLFQVRKGKGLPIGNLNSQFFANVYLNALDQFVKHILKCRHYLRYCADFILLSDSKKVLEIWEQEIATFLSGTLCLKLNQKACKLRPMTNGINFLGYIVRKDYCLVRRRVVGNFKQRLECFDRLLVSEEEGRRIYAFDIPVLDALFAVLNSYLGHFKHAKTFSLIRSLWEKYDFLSRYFFYNLFEKKLARKYVIPGNLQRVNRQYAHIQNNFSDAVIVLGMGLK
ncbi:RNA-directed DNA polymerase [Desulfobacter latus]|uniref:Reverse transcriptase n=1 Tax=Desulfobacter latus TaxID=2292 RepID=A0A850SVA3_9BACT|nr:RNA-directed DNA polymerase [Desulfobacter latus]NWH05294.1 reverse transcriptase [Desulfobacter latus]